MKKILTLKFSYLIVASLCLCSGCISHKEYSDEELTIQRDELKKVIERQENEIREKLLAQTECQRENSLNRQRLAIEKKELEARKIKYDEHVEKAKIAEEITRQSLLDHSRYYDIILRRQVFAKAPVKKVQGIYNGWTLIVDWKHPITENCIIRGGDFHFNKAYGDKNAYLVVLTPVVKDQYGISKERLTGNGEEENNADALTAPRNVQAFYGINRNYKVPCQGYHRITKNPARPEGLYAISGSMKINKFGADKQEPVNFVSDQLRSLGFILNYNFMIAAFAGDYVGMLVPADDAIAFEEPPKGDDGDSYYRCYDFATPNLQKFHNYSENFCVLLEVTESDRLYVKRRALFSLYGDYLIPK